MVASAQDNLDTIKQLEFQPESWTGAINLDEDHVKLLWSLFKYAQCLTNNHTFTTCPLLKHWSIKKKVCNDITPDATTTGAVHSAYVHSQSDDVQPLLSSSEVLDTIEESSVEDFESNVGFDLLADDVDNHEVDSTNNNVYPYPAFTVPLGSVKSVFSSLSGNGTPTDTFDVIIDSGCTKQMFPDRDLFLQYKTCSHSFVILTDKSKTACLGIGTVQLFLGGKSIILHDVLHVPCLRCPLLSIRCFRRLKGCSFLSNNLGRFLTFPAFFLHVDDSTDCIIKGTKIQNSTPPVFDSRLIGSVSADSDNTHHHSSRHPISTSHIQSKK